MRHRRARGASAAVAAAVMALSGAALASCSSAARSPGTGRPPGTGTLPVTGSPALSGSLNVFAAASLTGAFGSAGRTLQAAHPSLRITYDFAGSNTLVTQIEQGAPADVFASADVANMNRLVRDGLVATPVTFARNRLEIAVAPGNPKHINGLADLARPGVSVVLPAEGVPAGDYARQVLTRLHLSATPRSLETDVKSAIAKVVAGEADATVVYVTDVRAAGSSVTGIDIPDPVQPDITYPIAVVRSSHHQAAARAFVDSTFSGTVQDALESAGFLQPR